MARERAEDPECDVAIVKVIRSSTSGGGNTATGRPDELGFTPAGFAETAEITNTAKTVPITPSD